ncbi:unnamed protein product [Danaus chrysippus]|uniref:(African queen) hypothetical protein n=1 Tax=Danaus chrysippus TaxID=151541 RepID=A0A8J2QX82_9NEOP|nr:unnamed protein product [Danaus chrysippus]
MLHCDGESADSFVDVRMVGFDRDERGAFIKVESGEMYRVKSSQAVLFENGSFKCLLCKDETTEQHTNKSNNEREDKKVYSCNICNKRFTSRGLLLEHRNTHSGARPYECETCGKGFASKYTHQSHVKTHQARPRPFKCTQCGKSFFTLQNLNQHEKTHSGVKDFICERPFACEICGARFTQRLLDYHVKAAHTGERPLKCEVCRATFVYPEHYKKHARIHSGERPYSCESCGLRLLPVELPDGTSGWVAINQ